LGGDPVAALLIDIDHFKKINDGFGHDVGDEVLREFALRLASNVRAIDLPCRYGGEEFTVIMPDTQLVDALRIAERIRMHVSGSPFRVAHGSELLTVTISIGVSATSGPATPPRPCSSAPTRPPTRPRSPAATPWWARRLRAATSNLRSSGDFRRMKGVEGINAWERA
jgi:hypothetical protein